MREGSVAMQIAMYDRAMKVRAFVFDVGGTLWFEAKPVDEERVWRLEAEAVAPLLRASGITLPEPVAAIQREVWRRYEDTWREAQRRETYVDPSLPALIQSAMASRDVALSDEQAVAWWRAAWISVREFNVELYPDAIDVLSELRARGMKIGINTNRPCTAEMFLRDAADYGFARHVDAAVCSGDTGYVKPHPSTFELILERLGVAPEETAMIGDSCDADMAPARAMGMHTVLKLNGRYGLPPCEDADFEVHDLSEVLALPLVGVRPVRAGVDESLTPHEDENENRY